LKYNKVLTRAFDAGTAAGKFVPAFFIAALCLFLIYCQSDSSVNKVLMQKNERSLKSKCKTAVAAEAADCDLTAGCRQRYLSSGQPNVVWPQETQGEMMLILLRLLRDEFLHQKLYARK